MSLENKAVEAIRKVVANFASALGKITDEMLVAYFAQFAFWCEDANLCEIAGEPTKENITWKARDAKTGALPKGTELSWFRFLFPDIPEKREEYRKNARYNALQRYIHPHAERMFGIKKHRKARVEKEKKQTQPDVVDEKNVVQPTAIADIDYLLRHGVVQSMLDTIASFILSTDMKESARLLAYAQSHQVPKSYLAILEKKQAEYVQRAKDILAARSEKKVS